MIQRALDASDDERQRIAATLHDGVVQELAAASFAVAGGAEAAAARHQNELAERLRGRRHRPDQHGWPSLAGRRHLPAVAAHAGLPSALRDLAATGRARTAGPDPGGRARRRHADAEQQQAMFRIAQECLRNAVKHAEATEAELAVPGRSRRPPAGR